LARGLAGLFLLVLGGAGTPTLERERTEVEMAGTAERIAEMGMRRRVRMTSLLARSRGGLSCFGAAADGCAEYERDEDLELDDADVDPSL